MPAYLFELDRLSYDQAEEFTRAETPDGQSWRA